MKRDLIHNMCYGIKKKNDNFFSALPLIVLGRVFAKIGTVFLI